MLKFDARRRPSLSRRASSDVLNLNGGAVGVGTGVAAILFF
jgi:hypothetical protein